MSPAGPPKAECAWGVEALPALASSCDLFVVVDVLSFSTTLEIALRRGARVYPTAARGPAAQDLATRVGGTLAVPRGEPGFSLSPHSVLAIPPGTRLVLPSLNGAALSLAAARSGRPVLGACLRNAAAVARSLPRGLRRVAVLPAGERRPDGTLRFALEDWWGAGAVLAALEVDPSAEARAAIDAFQAARPDLRKRIAACESGRELIEAGYPADVDLAAELDVSDVVPELRGAVYVDRASRREGSQPLRDDATP